MSENCLPSGMWNSSTPVAVKEIQPNVIPVAWQLVRVPRGDGCSLKFPQLEDMGVQIAAGM